MMASSAKTYMLFALAVYLLAGQFAMLLSYIRKSLRELDQPPRFATWGDMWSHLVDDIGTMSLHFWAWPYFLHRAVFRTPTEGKPND